MGLGRHVRGCFVLAMRWREEEGPLRLLTGEHRCIAGNTTPEGPFEDSDLPPLLPSLSLPPRLYPQTLGPACLRHFCVWKRPRTHIHFSVLALDVGIQNYTVGCHALGLIRISGRFPGTRILRSHCRGPHGAGVGVEPRICI